MNGRDNYIERGALCTHVGRKLMNATDVSPRVCVGLVATPDDDDKEKLVIEVNGR
jgi:hypothetical protein